MLRLSLIGWVSAEEHFALGSVGFRTKAWRLKKKKKKKRSLADISTGGGEGGGGGGGAVYFHSACGRNPAWVLWVLLTARELGIKQCSQKKKRRENQTNKKARKKAVRCGKSREVTRAVGRIGHAT